MKYKPILSIHVFLLAYLCVNQALFAKTHIVFRYDDFSADALGTRAGNSERREIWEMEQKMDVLFAKYHFPYVIAFIPDTDLTSFRKNLFGNGCFLFEE